MRPAARIPASRLAASSVPLHVLLIHGGHGRTHPHAGGKKSHNGCEKGTCTGSNEKACSGQAIGELNHVFVHFYELTAF